MARADDETLVTRDAVHLGLRPATALVRLEDLGNEPLLSVDLQVRPAGLEFPGKGLFTEVSCPRRWEGEFLRAADGVV